MGNNNNNDNNNNNNNNNDFISKALFHVKHVQLHCTMPMNNTHTHDVDLWEMAQICGEMA